MALLVTAVGAAFSWGALHFWQAGKEFREGGVTAQATVLKKYRKGGGLENYYATFGFTDRFGKSYTVEMKLRSRAWRGIREGGTGPVTYLPDSPERAEFGPRWGKQLLGWFYLFFALVGGAMAVIGAGTLIAMLLGLVKPNAS
jgi:hypothetical protein